MKEVFKDIPGYEGLYQVSNFGNVKSLNYRRTGKVKLLSPSIASNGYYTVLLRNEVLKKRTVHQLVAIAFLNHVPCGYKLVVNHIDHNPLNNHVDNLEIVTNRYNSGYRKSNGASKYTGVSWDKSLKKFRSNIWINGRLKHLGVFKNEDEAGRAYQKALLNL